MKTYIFPIEFEEADHAWHVYVPGLERQGAATWGRTRDEALRNIQEVVQMLVEEMLEEGQTLPSMITVSDQASVAVCV
jgi:predicted RNase H-like HicB family nuclease